MAEKMYIGVGGVAKAVDKIYIGVGGVAKEVDKVYIGVGGVAKLAYSSGTGYTVTLSGETVDNTVPSGGDLWAGIRINTDGTIDKKTGSATFTQIDGSTDWIIPNGSAATDFEFRITSVTWNSGGTTFEESPGVDGTWFDLTGGALVWSVRDATTPATPQDVQFTLEVRKNGGSTLDTGSYRLIADNTP